MLTKRRKRNDQSTVKFIPFWHLFRPTTITTATTAPLAMNGKGGAYTRRATPTGARLPTECSNTLRASLQYRMLARTVTGSSSLHTIESMDVEFFCCPKGARFHLYIRVSRCFNESEPTLDALRETIFFDRPTE